MARYVHNNLEMYVFIEQTRIHLYIQYVCTPLIEYCIIDQCSHLKTLMLKVAQQE